jgi:hypothetical protein
MHLTYFFHAYSRSNNLHIKASKTSCHSFQKCLAIQDRGLQTDAKY